MIPNRLDKLPAAAQLMIRPLKMVTQPVHGLCPAHHSLSRLATHWRSETVGNHTTYRVSPSQVAIESSVTGVGFAEREFAGLTYGAIETFELIASRANDIIEIQLSEIAPPGLVILDGGKRKAGADNQLIVKGTAAAEEVTIDAQRKRAIGAMGACQYRSPVRGRPGRRRCHL